jgi:branched-chain amino acid aminotransferase
VIHPYLLHNGQIRPSSDSFLSAGQVGLLSGWGVFSTIRVYSGIPFAFDRHWARLMKDAALTRVPHPPDPAPVYDQMLALVRANRAFDASLRLIIVRNRGGLWEGPGIDRDFDVIAFTADVNPWPETVRLGLIPHARHAACSFAGAKILSWACNLAWYEGAHAKGFDEVVLLNERGEVSECTSANIFAAEGGVVWTPPLSSGCLPGVTRQVLLEEIHAPGFEVREKALLPADLERADEVFITSTTRHLLPVASIEGSRLQRRGAACTTLRQAFAAYVDVYVQAHKNLSA